MKRTQSGGKARGMVVRSCSLDFPATMGENALLGGCAWSELMGRDGMGQGAGF